MKQIDTNADLTNQNVSLEKPQVRPWVRYWARYIDIIWFSILLGMLLGIVSPGTVEKMNEFAIGMVVLIAWIFVEAAFLYAVGSTPGKFLLKVRIERNTGDKPKLSECLGRSFKVWFKGMGVGLPLIGLVAQCFAYSDLTNKGSTSWDKEGNFLITHSKIGVVRITIAIAISALFFFFIILDGKF